MIGFGLRKKHYDTHAGHLSLLSHNIAWPSHVRTTQCIMPPEALFLSLKAATITKRILSFQNICRKIFPAVINGRTNLRPLDTNGIEPITTRTPNLMRLFEQLPKPP